ncbi:hypothetical protein [Aureispira anguillae]|uniref:Lipoprotein n=1 Tax=Aureispira anguillae TaxID=2864201 RepID=A0A916DRI5_9BACT|nr:hypothetical protein [Aureispira anguillae]BDS11286.1 hypothetical protein AsAng_0019980 [Aureispira anguillae]
MVKIQLLIITSICLFLLIGCNSSSSTVPTREELQALPDPTPTPTAKGAMTNQSPEDITPIVIDETTAIPPEELLGYIQNAIIPIYKDWVILKNGTYIIFDDMNNIPDIQTAAIQLLNDHKPKTPEDNNWDFSITDLDRAEGWSVYGNGYGIYTYVHPKEISVESSPQEISAYAKAKRALDEKNPQIIFVSSPQGIVKIQ